MQKKMPILGLEPHSLFTKDTVNTHSITWAAERNMPILGLEPNSLFPNDTGNTRSTIWAAERIMPILGLEPIQFISEGYGQQAFYYLGCRKIYAYIDDRTNTVYFRWLQPTRFQLPGLQKEKLPLLGFEQTQFISEGYCQHAFNYLGCRKKYADIGTRTNTVNLRRLLSTRVQQPGLLKEICRYWDSNHTVYYRRLLATRVQLPGLQKEICQYWDPNHTVYFRKLLATRVQLPGLQNDICRYRDSNQHTLFSNATAKPLSTTWAAEIKTPILRLETHGLFPKDTGNVRSTTWAAERNMSILGLEPTRFIFEGFRQLAFNYLGCRKEYADIGARTNTVYSRRLLPTRFHLHVLQKEKCRYWDSNHTVYFRSVLATRVHLPGLQKEICRYLDSKQHSLFPKATGNTRSSTWAVERNMPIFGFEPTLFISEGYCQHGFNNLGSRNKYADILIRTT